MLTWSSSLSRMPWRVGVDVEAPLSDFAGRVSGKSRIRMMPRTRMQIAIDIENHGVRRMVIASRGYPTSLET